jgi:hypothetical protein
MHRVASWDDAARRESGSFPVFAKVLPRSFELLVRCLFSGNSLLLALMREPRMTPRRTGSDAETAVSPLA